MMSRAAQTHLAGRVFETPVLNKTVLLVMQKLLLYISDYFKKFLAYIGEF